MDMWKLLGRAVAAGGTLPLADCKEETDLRLLVALGMMEFDMCPAGQKICRVTEAGYDAAHLAEQRERDRPEART